MYNLQIQEIIKVIKVSSKISAKNYFNDKTNNTEP